MFWLSPWSQLLHMVEVKFDTCASQCLRCIQNGFRMASLERNQSLHAGAHAVMLKVRVWSMIVFFGRSHDLGETERQMLLWCAEHACRSLETTPDTEGLAGNDYSQHVFKIQLNAVQQGHEICCLFSGPGVKLT